MSAVKLQLVEESTKTPAADAAAAKTKSEKPRAKKVTAEKKAPCARSAAGKASEAGSTMPEKSTKGPKATPRKTSTKESSSKAGPAKAPGAKTKKREAVASDVMRTPAVRCSIYSSLNDAARLMWEADLGAIVVVNDADEPVSMITDRDICMAAYTQGIALYHGGVGAAMSKSIITASMNTTVDELCDRMAEAQVRRMPIVDETGKLVGIVGLSDIMKEANASVPAERKRGSSGLGLVQLMDSIFQA